MKISDAIEKALFDENTGYYRKKFPIGGSNDFITAPEITQVFGEIIAIYLLQISSTKNNKIALVEMGAGNGTMFFDVLNAVKKLAEKENLIALNFLENTTFHIVEISESLTKEQQEKLRVFSVNWHKNFSDFSTDITSQNREIFFIANELFDCFPIDQFVKTDIGWCERIITEKENKKLFSTANFSTKTNNEIIEKIGAEQHESAPFGAIFEHSEKAEKFMAELCQSIQNFDGIAIIIDYGYIKNEFANTLQAVKNHQKVDFLENLNDADITALVNFDALQKISDNHSLQSSLITQKDFLIGLGIEQRRETLLKDKNSQQQEEINSAIDRLVDEKQMGELFKVMIVWK